MTAPTLPYPEAWFVAVVPSAAQAAVSYWAGYFFPDAKMGQSARGLAEAAMYAIASVLPAGGGSVVMVPASNPSAVYATAPWGTKAQKTLEEGGGGWWSDFVQRWAGTWWRR